MFEKRLLSDSKMRLRVGSLVFTYGLEEAQQRCRKEAFRWFTEEQLKTCYQEYMHWLETRET